MATTQSKWVNGNLVFHTSTRDNKWLDAIGATARKYIEDFIVVPIGEDDNDPPGWTLTAIAGDAGDGTFTAGVGGGGELVITPDSTENDGISMQHAGEAWLMAVGDPLYFGIRLKMLDADQTDLSFGLAVTDTSFNTAVADACYWEVDDQAATCGFVTENTNTETTTAAGTFGNDTYAVLEFYWDGVDTIKSYWDDVLVATHTTNLPTDEELTFSLELLTGEGVANTVTIDWIRIIQCQ